MSWPYLLTSHCWLFYIHVYFAHVANTYLFHFTVCDWDCGVGRGEKLACWHWLKGCEVNREGESNNTVCGHSGSYVSWMTGGCSGKEQTVLPQSSHLTSADWPHAPWWSAMIGVSWRHAGLPATPEYNNRVPRKHRSPRDVSLGKHWVVMSCLVRPLLSCAYHMLWL